MTRWLTILGVGDDGVAGLVPAARELLDGAEIVVGSKRVIDGTSFGSAEVHTWSEPITSKIDELKNWRGRKVAVLATGDPMHYGVGSLLVKRFGIDETTIIPSPSAFSLAAARLGWPLQDVETISLHGRPVPLLQPLLQPNARIIALTAGPETLREVIDCLNRNGFPESRLTVLEHMGGVRENQVSFVASTASPPDIAQFCTLGIECVAAADANWLPRVPGLPDEAYVHDGQLTKQEVRAATLAALQPRPGALLWDVGAGCGSVSVEWVRTSRGARAIAFERDPERITMIKENASALGAPGIEIVAGDVPGTLNGALQPDAIFLGGAVSDAGVFEACWQALPEGGRMVCNSVTLEGEAAQIARQDAHGGDLLRIDVSTITKVGRKHALRPRMSVLQWRATKG